MGRPMAARLAELGFPLRVYNRTASAAKAMSGVAAFSSPGECVRGCDIIITMLADAASVEAVLEEGGVLTTLASERRTRRPVLVEMSTIGRAAAVRIGKKVEAHNARFVDAPVSGTTRPARRGELVALVGGSIKSVERARPVLDALCKKVIHAGSIGQGQALKVVLNGIGAHHLVGLASGLALSDRAGLARDIVLDAVTSGAFATPSYIGKRDKLLARDYSPEFSLTLALKDVALNVELQHECGMKLPVLRTIVQEIQDGVQSGLGDLDLFALERRYS
jgi:3-hydroxyisobutyrate dehydrogenase